MQVNEITLKANPIVPTHDFFEKTDQEIEDIGSKKTVCLVVQDYTRIHKTITNCIVSRLMEKVGPERLIIVIASGMHRASSWSDMNSILGNGVAGRVRVYSHNPLQTFSPKKSWFKIALHCSTPHNVAGMSSAGKMLVPGLADSEIAMTWHGEDRWNARRTLESLNREFDAVFDYCIDVEGNFIDWYVGRGFAAYDSYLDKIIDHYKVIIPRELPDVAVLEPIMKVKDFILTMNALTVCHDRKIVKTGGTVCICTPRPDHMGTHYLYQQPNGKIPAVYDKIFDKPLKDANIAFCTPGLPYHHIQDYFEKPVFYFTESERFYMFIKSIYGDDVTVNEYHGSDMMIGVDEE